MPKKWEVRTNVGADVSSSGRTLSGYAAKFNSLSEQMPSGWYERIQPGAFSRALRERQDVRALVNHDPSQLLGRTRSGTLTLREDSTGLRFQVDLPDTTYARDLLALMDRGDMAQCSFGFVTLRDKWVNEDGQSIRELHDLNLMDVSVVTYPAYGNTEVSFRSIYGRTVKPRSQGVYPADELDLEREKLRQAVRLRMHV